MSKPVKVALVAVVAAFLPHIPEIISNCNYGWCHTFGSSIISVSIAVYALLHDPNKGQWDGVDRRNQQ